VDECKYGIQLNSSQDNVLRNNSMQADIYGFGASGKNDIDTSNLVNSRPVYYLVGRSDQIIDASSGAGAVCCVDCINMTFRDLVLESNPYGIYLYNTSQSTIENFSLENSVYGIRLEESSGNAIGNNTARNNTCGISLVNSADDVIQGNRLLENVGAGLSLELSNESTIEGNDASGNLQGIIISASDGNLIARNNVSYNRQSGVFLFESLGNRIEMNRIFGNPAGIKLESPWKTYVASNAIYENEVGLIVKCGINNNLSANNISNNRVGISVDKSGNNTINNLMLNNAKDEEELPPCSQTTAHIGSAIPGIEVNINSDPEGAEVMVKGQYVGDTPLSYTFEKRDDYAVKLKLVGYNTSVTTISIPGTKNLTIKLIPEED
jgi:parallel beta-helix repeat protein